MEHTKGEIRIVNPDSLHEDCNIVIGNNHMLDISSMRYDNNIRGRNKAKANAERIVKTWNAHDALVKIAKARLESIGRYKNQSSSSIHELRSIENLLKTLEE